MYLVSTGWSSWGSDGQGEVECTTRHFGWKIEGLPWMDGSSENNHCASCMCSVYMCACMCVCVCVCAWVRVHECVCMHALCVCIVCVHMCMHVYVCLNSIMHVLPFRIGSGNTSSPISSSYGRKLPTHFCFLLPLTLPPIKPIFSSYWLHSLANSIYLSTTSHYIINYWMWWKTSAFLKLVTLTHLYVSYCSFQHEALLGATSSLYCHEHPTAD